MDHPYLLHIFSPTKYVSPFDINMAYEAQFDDVIPYCNVELDEVHGLTQDTIFSRSREGVKRTGIFIGGREFGLALDMLEAARKAMVPPFEVSVMADPSGAITTAAAMVALAEDALTRASGGFSGSRVCVFGGTGPVGMCVALLAARAGADAAIVSHQGLGAAQLVADRMTRQFGERVRGLDGSSSEAVSAWFADIDVAFSAAKAGVRVVDAAQLAAAHALKVVADANAVPPSGIEGVDANDRGKPLPVGGGRTASALGALAIGDVKYRVHTALLRQMYSAPAPVYLAHDEAYAVARDIVAAGA